MYLFLKGFALFIWWVMLFPLALTVYLIRRR